MHKLWLMALVFLNAFAYELPTVPSVDMERYLGRWYEIARFDHSFERGCDEVEAFYTLRDDGMIGVENSCFKRATQKKNVAYGRAKVVDEVSRAKLKVTFFWPFYGDYWIVDVAEDYSYAMVSEPSKRYFWILSRTPTIDEDVLSRLLSYANYLGFDTEKIIWRTPLQRDEVRRE
ncbi:lipocalin family protein [Sulfurospirillum barnesii]|uniref:Bacterial lipocalin n=1 Tax=Sulfurospirillum barnesii (strain ATCC 700032 / DSM 10660 / SES-3) TaxID=760154 RepID=I3XYS7_SULBS|nr:lipocalin family protein [Sulfurospirillum barnesii]AFL69101.1 bacterial lipocalin [Sulfurospirillum barnesii SES-3]